ncbi:MAG: universal stress protein [Spirochaetes bacterium]|uniref:Universal stress protein n=1 Tax=Candidatus Ornithospirochaeta stercoripullorum TaxID=2840899 RepID=A0A9D9E2P7_9SPIO|nr:universal stress protein [Candidatus Ornithospirochaeta stercoripullorum]
MGKAPYHSILVYLDGSEGSMTAAMYAILLASSSNAKLHAVYVVNTKALGDLVRARIFIDQEKNEFLEDLKKDAGRHIRHTERLAASKDVEIITASLEGSPHKEILSYIKKNDIDLLVLGPVNAIRSRRDELTGENDRMLRTSPCPVVVVRDADDSIWQQFEEV